MDLMTRSRRDRSRTSGISPARFRCIAAATAATLIAAPTASLADASTEAALKEQMLQMQTQLAKMAASQQALQAKIDKLSADKRTRKVIVVREKPADAPPLLANGAPGSLTAVAVADPTRAPWHYHDTQTTVTSGSAFMVKAPGSGGGLLSTRVFDTNVALYGFLDISGDTAFNGQKRINEISSNESFLGIRASRELGSTGLRAIAQIETMAEISATPGVASSLASRNSFGGLETPFGTIMAGKNDTPYKRSTALMDPFYGSVGDYNSIMGNTAGEGRTEFDYRMPHSVFYDSPNIYGFTANLLYSPGQKLDNLSGSGASNNAFPQGELVCSGSQQPSLNGATPNTGTGGRVLCNDGAFKDAYSAALNYERGPLYLTAAWELHKSVDRTSDAGGVVADEAAMKVGATYHFWFGNQLSAIYEHLERDGVNPATNERQRNGFYISDVQDLTHGFELMAAWAHAGETPGSPKFPGLSDRADMYAGGLKYHFDSHTSLYLITAYLTQGAGAHYGLGAGEGHGTPVLSPRTQTGAPFPGQSINATSAGFQYAF